LRVDPDDSLVCATDIGGVDREVRQFPDGVSLSDPLLISLETFFDGVLMRSREGSEDKLSSVRMSRVDRQTGALGHGVGDREDVGEI